MNPRSAFRAALALLVMTVFVSTLRAAGIPQTIAYQGYLATSGGVPVNATQSMVFTLYDAGDALWTETQSVTVANGVFNVTLGSVTPISLPFDAQYFLGVKVGADAEMMPRQALSTSPYAFRAATADAVAGTATISGSQITGAISAAGSGSGNAAIGVNAFASNTTGFGNAAIGVSALSANTEGYGNTASGYLALVQSSTGWDNTASGAAALVANTSGSQNTATGANSLHANTTGINNTASGNWALGSNTTGSNNIGIGLYAGNNLTTGDSNIAIGNAGVAGEANTIRIGNADHTRTFVAGIRDVTPANADLRPVVVDSNGQLGSVAPQYPAGTVYVIPGSGGGAGGGYLVLNLPNDRASFYIYCNYGSPGSNYANWYAGINIPEAYRVTAGSMEITHLVRDNAGVRPIEAFKDLAWAPNGLGFQDGVYNLTRPWHGVFTANHLGTLTRFDVTVTGSGASDDCTVVVYASGAGPGSYIGHPGLP